MSCTLVSTFQFCSPEYTAPWLVPYLPHPFTNLLINFVLKNLPGISCGFCYSVTCLGQCRYVRSVRTEATDGYSSLYLSKVVVVVARQRFAHRFNVIAIVTMATCIVTYRRLCNVCGCHSHSQCEECDGVTYSKAVP
jgi:hypothetical protein